ncbi:MAG: MFS transporter, partial [Acidobacteria bacterium]|nr:MFS transporter [Acidobacteriota bacterium]
FMQIVGPALAALLVQWLGAGSCFILDSLSFFVSAGLVASLTIHRVPITAEHAARSVIDSLRQSVKFIFTHPSISFVVIAMTAGMFAIRCFSALLSVYVRDVLASNSTAFGLLNSLIGLGMIVASQFLPRLSRAFSPQSLVLAGLGGMGLAVFLAAALGLMPAAAAAMLSLGFFAAFVMIPAQTLLQRETPQEMLGRVSSSLFSLLSFSQVLAMLGAGPFAQAAGIRNLYYASAAMLLLIAASGFYLLHGRNPHRHDSLERIRPE